MIFAASASIARASPDGNHPDVRFVEPLAGKKEISIQQVREFERELNYRSFRAGVKSSSSIRRR